MTSAIKDFLSSNGLWSEPALGDSPFIKSISRILPQDADSLKLAFALDLVVSRHGSNRMLLAKLCALLSQTTGKGPTEIAVCLYSAAPDLSRSISEISKLVKAGEMWLRWPMLEDIENPDKLATLKRVPSQMKAQVFGSGQFPDGTSIRSLTCTELRAAVNALRTGQSPKPQTDPPARVAKQALVKLANEMSGLSELMNGIPEMQDTQAKIDQWYSDLLRILSTTPEKVRPTIIIRPSADNNRAVMSQVTYL